MYILCKLVNTGSCQWYTHSVSPGCEQINEKLFLRMFNFKYSHRCTLISIMNCTVANMFCGVLIRDEYANYGIICS